MTLIVSNIIQDFVLQNVGKNGQIPLFGKISSNVLFLKLFRHMPLFWNSILIKSSFSEELEFHELKFLEKFQVELKFHNFYYVFF